MKTCFLDKKSQEIIGGENYPIEEADRIVAMNPESINKDMGEVFVYLCTNISNRIEFIETPYLNTERIMQYTDEAENTPGINLYPVMTDILLDAYTLTKEGKTVVRSHIIRKAAADGKQMGTKKGTRFITEKSLKYKPIIVEKSKHFNGTMNDKELRAELGISINTLRRYIKQLQEEQKEK